MLNSLTKSNRGPTNSLDSFPPPLTSSYSTSIIPSTSLVEKKTVKKKLSVLWNSERESNPKTLLMPIEVTEPLSIIQKKLTRKSTITKTVKNCVTRCSYKTKTGTSMNQTKKENQDVFIIHSNLQGIKGQYLFAVCDGHGEQGHLVSRFIKSKLHSVLEKNLWINDGKENVYDVIIKDTVREISEYILESEIDIEFSGSTLVFVVILGNFLICGNLGDSRAVLGRKNLDWEAVDLSLDHKPDRQDEATRIIQFGGRIEASNNVGALRIWKKYEDIPGLAMTRSIGDNAARSIGLISVPEITYRLLEKKDKFIIIASDGVWDCITSQDAVEIVASVFKEGKSEACCEKILTNALKKWENISDSIDDITVIVVFLNTR